MECPKGYRMGSNGVCEQVGGYARGGMTPLRNSKPLLDSREEYSCDDAMMAISECHSQSGQSTGPGQCHSTAGCSCTDAGGYWPPQSWNWYGYCMCMPTWNLLQYAANCRYAGPQFPGSGGGGTTRRMGGQINRNETFGDPFTCMGRCDYDSGYSVGCHEFRSCSCPQWYKGGALTQSTCQKASYDPGDPDKSNQGGSRRTGGMIRRSRRRR